jgi:ubiquinone/menaquinone biosynthesis C-methylase UbiE
MKASTQLTEPSPRRFVKYAEGGAYHWDECNPRSPRWNPGLVARYDAVVRRVPPGATVLDVGCGDGYLMHLLSPMAKQVVGIDPEHRAVELAEEKLAAYENCRVCTSSGYALSFPDRSFDVVVLADVVEHLNAPDQCLSEAARVVRDTGIVVVTTPRRREKAISVHHVTEYRVEELCAMLQRHFVSVTLTGIWPMFWIRLWETRVGFRLFPRIARWLGNPLLREGVPAERFATIVATCAVPQRINEQMIPPGT